MASHVHSGLSLLQLFRIFQFGLLLLFCLIFLFLTLLNVQGAVLLILLCFNYLSHILENRILPQLVPMQVDLRTVGVGLFNSPPGPISSK